MKNITSPQNTQFKTWLSLLEKKGLKKHSLFILSGTKVIPETWQHQKGSITQILYSEKHSENIQYQQPNIETFRLTHSLFEQLDIFGTHSPLFICKQPELLPWDLKKRPQGLEILCPLGDPQNLGALIRSCAAFNVSKIVLLQESCSPFLPKSLRAASGQIWNVPLCKGPSIHKISCNLFSLDKDGESLYNFQWPADSRLLIGQEGLGVPKDLKKQSLSIPISPQVESLNATHSAIIALSSYHAQHN